MVDDKDTPGGDGCDLNCTMVPRIDSDKGWLMLDGSSGGLSSDEGLRIYSRTKRRKMSNSESGFNHKKKQSNGSAYEQYVHRLTFGNGPGECSLGKCSSVVLQQKHQSLNGHENAIVTYSQSGSTPVIKELRDDVERSENRTNNPVIKESHDDVERSEIRPNSSAQEPSRVQSRELLKKQKGYTSSELCERALSDTLNSAKFFEFRNLLLKKFGVVNANRVLNVDAVSSKLKNGAYETSPMLYLKDILQVFTKLEEIGNEMVTIAKILSDTSRGHYDQHVRKQQQQPNPVKARTAEACHCRGCDEKADVKNCLVCDSCEDIYHLSCTELVGTPILPKSWYCATCVSNGIGSPHDSCLVCEKLKSVASVPLVPANNQSQDVPDGLDEHLHNDDTQCSMICFICKSEVMKDDNYRTCGHALCAHKFYHYKCLTSKQLGVCGPYWYCPSCLCRDCLVDKDDDQIVLCDGCDQAYHIYCTTPQLTSIPEGSWYCGKCDQGLKRIREMKRLYEDTQKQVKIEVESEKDEHEAPVDDELGLDMLVTAAKTLSQPSGYPL